MATFDEFWGRMGPGLLGLGVGLYDKRSGQNEAAKRLATAQGPLFQQAMGGAQATLGEAGTFNPDALAASRFGAQEEMLKPLQDKQLADLQRMLYAKGMLGTANYNPSTVTASGEQLSIAPTGQAMNPHIAAFYAAQNADRAKRAQASLLEGQDYADRLVNRAGGLQRVAGNTQATGITAQRTQPSRAAGNAEILKGLTGMLAKNPGIVKDAWKWGAGLFGGGGSDGYGGDMGDLFFDW